MVTPLPAGVRCVALASRGKLEKGRTDLSGRTLLHDASGKLLFKTSSILPAGNQGDRRPNASILDCIYWYETFITFRANIELLNMLSDI